ncbi:MAG: cyclic nucleotide-binding domain-containing protein [Methyloligellaceae bacterium]
MNAALWSWAITVATVAFQQAGAPAVALVLAARLIPGAISAPFATVLASRMPGLLGLIVIALIRAGAISLGALILLSDGPFSLLYVAIVIEGIGSGPMHALHMRMLPLIARKPDELAAANSLTELLRAAGLLIGPILSALVLSVGDASQAMLLSIILLLATLPLLQKREGAIGAVPGTSMTSPFSQLKDGALATMGDAKILILVAVSLLCGLIIGGIQVFTTAIAIDILRWGPPGPSILLGLFGLGGLLGGLLSLPLAGRKDLSGPLALGLVCIGLACIILGAFAFPAPVITVCVAGGIGLSVLLVMLNALLQRTVALPMQAAVFGLSTFVQLVGVGLGGSVGSAFIHMWGLADAPIIFGLCLIGFGLILWRLVLSIIAKIDFYEREFEIVRQSKLFRMLTVGPSMQVASCLERHMADAGEVLIRQGDRGEDAYLVGTGRVSVIVDGTTIAELGPGDVFGEIALLKDVPRTGTIVSATPTELWKLNRDAFLFAVTGTPDCNQTISSIAQRRLQEIANFRK